MIRTHLCRKPAKLAPLRRLLHRGVAPECDDAKLVPRPHGFVEQPDDFLFRLRGIGRHGFAAVGHDDHCSGAVG